MKDLLFNLTSFSHYSLSFSTSHPKPETIHLGIHYLTINLALTYSGLAKTTAKFTLTASETNRPCFVQYTYIYHIFLILHKPDDYSSSP